MIQIKYRIMGRAARWMKTINRLAPTACVAVLSVALVALLGGLFMTSMPGAQSAGSPRPGVIPSSVPRIPGRTQDCGPKSLYSVVLAAGNAHDLSYSDVRDRFYEHEATTTSVSALQICQVAQAYGLQARVAELKFSMLVDWLAPGRHWAIMHCGGCHFVPALAADDSTIVLCDPAVGLEIVDESKLQAGRYRWKNVAILLDVEPPK